MRDFHCHILPSLDDGAVSYEESLRMASLLADFGFKEVCATPHFLKGCYEPDATLVVARLRELQQRLDESGIPVLLRQGMEYCLDEFFSERICDLLPLAGETMVLAEIPFGGVPEIVYDNAEILLKEGFTPVIAHPERSPLLFDAPVAKRKNRFQFSTLIHSDTLNETMDSGGVCPSALFGALSDLGCLFQGNLGSFVGYYGEGVRKRAYFLFSHGHYECFGSDAHEAESLMRILDGSVRLKSLILGE